MQYMIGNDMIKVQLINFLLLRGFDLQEISAMSDAEVYALVEYLKPRPIKTIEHDPNI